MFVRRVGPWQIKIQVEPVLYSQAELTRTYEQVAGLWHTGLTWAGYQEAYRSAFEQLVQLGWFKHIASGERILDCGIGSGAFSQAFLRVLDRNLQLHGVDLSSQMLEQTEEKLTQSAHLSRQDAGHLAYPMASFGAVLSAHMLEHFEQPLSGIQEMVRVLRPGGVLVLSFTRRSPVSAAMSAFWRNRSFTSADMLDWLRQAGLSDRYVLSYALGSTRWVSLCVVGRKP
ncbi:MAG: class I SAM-dependent methyltransferase [Chloroflexi bacterium]|nr:class I SAM-dependent methyltransferase [Chloroflexota bacterium]